MADFSRSRTVWAGTGKSRYLVKDSSSHSTTSPENVGWGGKEVTDDTSLNDPRERRQDPELRRASKKTFGSQYRVEVANAINSFQSEWTTRDLAERFPNREDVPWSCIAKEINALVDLGYVRKTHGKTSDGRKTYATTDQFPSFWQFIRDISTHYGSPTDAEFPNNVRRLHR
jgi:DNA-binding HxlR family transcriptional regulator